MRRFIYMSLLAVSVLAGCSRTADLTEPEETQEEIMISGLTRVGSASDVTYRTLLLNTTSGKYLGLSGSYRAKDAKEWMTACQVNAAGEWNSTVQMDNSYAFRGLWSNRSNPSNTACV
ncbi:MAG: hypothetical protein K6C37_07395 [Bacteroidales bacterium]|nr:hypothetical protein [Bacteroidales bacterium]